MNLIVVSTVWLKNGFSWKIVNQKWAFQVAFYNNYSEIMGILSLSLRNNRCPHGKLIHLHEIYRNLHNMANLNRIKIVLFEQNKTGKWLAGQLGKSPCTVSKWCQNSIQPDLRTLNGIANLLDVDVKDLLCSNK